MTITDFIASLPQIERKCGAAYALEQIEGWQRLDREHGIERTPEEHAALARAKVGLQQRAAKRA